MRSLPSRKLLIITLIALVSGIFMINYASSSNSLNGFDLSNSSLPSEQIIRGGPPRDGIPALTNPEFITAEDSNNLSPTDRVVGIVLNGQARAYPINILNWHEIVNDNIAGQRVAITYCPLCGTAVAFDARIDGSATEFGVSGLLYNNDVLLYDRNTESLWSQILSEAISGELIGKKLSPLPISHTTWRDWHKKNPETLVLSEETGHFRNYGRDPYAGYEQSRRTFFAVNAKAPDTYHPKEIVLGLGVEGVYKAYPFIELDKQGKTHFSDSVNGVQFNFDWDSENRSITVKNAKGQPVAGIQGFWFAWFAFHPDTEVFQAQG